MLLRNYPLHDYPLMTDIRIVITTAGDRAEAERIAQILVEERLAACVNLLPGVRSIYRWQSAVEAAEEVLLLIKTRQDSVDAVRSRVLALHSYEVPEFLVLSVESGSEAYLAWIAASAG